MNSNSNTASTSGVDLMLPCITTSESVSPVSSSAAERRSGYLRVSLKRGGRSFCSQLMRFPPLPSGRPLGDLIHSRAYCSQPCRGARSGLVRRSGFDLLDDAAADDHAVGVRGNGLRAGGVADAEA